MKIIKPSATIENPKVFTDMLKRIEKVARTCYKSEEYIKLDSDVKLVSTLIKSGHEAMIEHGGMISVRFIVDRGISHELVRHRLSSFAQESTRYCNYAKDKFGNELTFIKPFFFENKPYLYNMWECDCIKTEQYYMSLLASGATPQEARTVLNNSIKTEIVMTANPREWRNFFKLRCPKDAHPQMREVTLPLLNDFKQSVPVLFDDLCFED